jgi:aryl-alcohol dehydrogenase-like predicted oxidoreductase
MSGLEFRELGKTGIKISAVGLGTWQWGSREWGWGRLYRKQDVIDAFQKAVELGINFIDTAEIYGMGKSEEILGEAMQGHREDVVIASKVWPLNLTYRGVLRAAERSLRRLRVDVIDLYQIHWPNPLFPIQNTMKAMKKLVRDGKVRSVGVSNFKLRTLKASQHALAPLEIASNQVRYNLLDREIERELLPYAQTEDITIIAYSPLAQGLLTGRYRSETRPNSFIQSVNPGFSSRNLNRLSELNTVLGELGSVHERTPAQVALNWLTTKGIVVPIPGVKNVEQAVSDAGAVGWTLTNSELESLEKAATEVEFDKLSAIPNLLRAVTRFG